MGPIKKIAYNCRKATFLIEKQQIDNITLREKLELRFHLGGCSICKIFQQQSILINKMMGKHFIDQHKHITLDNEFKVQLQQQIDKQLSKN